MFIKLCISNMRKTCSQPVMKFVFDLYCLSVLGSPMKCIILLFTLFNFIYSLQQSGNYSKQGEGWLKFVCYLTKLFYLSALVSLRFLRTLETKVKFIFCPSVGILGEKEPKAWRIKPLFACLQFILCFLLILWYWLQKMWLTDDDYLQRQMNEAVGEKAIVG